MSDFEALANRLDSQIIEILYLMDLGVDTRDIFIGVVQSEAEDHDSSEVAQLINRLFHEIETSGTDWFDLYLGGTIDTLGKSKVEFDMHDRVHFKLNGITIGQFFTNLIYNGLPIEASHEGETAAKVSFAIGDNYVLDLKGEGSFDTEYFYEGGVEDPDRDNYLGSQIDYKMQFSADLFHCPALNAEA